MFYSTIHILTYYYHHYHYHMTADVHCVNDANGKVLVESDQVRELWGNYMDKLMNENT